MVPGACSSSSITAACGHVEGLNFLLSKTEEYTHLAGVGGDRLYSRGQ